MKLEHDIDAYLNKVKNSDSYFHTFIDRPGLAAGVLVLKPGEEDTQAPHDSDETYYVISGNGYLKIKDRDYKVTQGKLFFVGKNAEHHFHGNTRELRVLYFFGGPDS